MNNDSLQRSLSRLLLAAGLCTALSAALAQPPAAGPMTFEAFDGNGDGTVTEQEFTSARAERMGARAAQGAPMRGAANAPPFSFFDLNGDGRMTPDEFAAARQSRMQQMGRGPGFGPGAGPGRGPGMGPGMGPPGFSQFDTNGDGSLTKQEFYNARAQRMGERAQQGFPMRNAPYAPSFESIDANGDGQVNPQEFAGAQAQHRQQMMQRPMPQPPRPPQPPQPQ